MGQHLQEQNFYEILEVAPDAPQDEIHRAYQRAKETYNPESASLYTMFTREEASEVLKLIDEAFATLSNQSRRRDYDSKLRLNAKKMPDQVRMDDFASDELLRALPDIQYEPAPQVLARPEASKPKEPQRQREAHAPVHSVRSNFAESKPAHDNQLPAGFQRTRFSVFEVDSKFEEEIKATTVFDGPVLQKIRLYKKVTLEHISEETRISRTYLAAVETNDYTALPAPVFVRGFIVQICRILGLDADKIAKSYVEIMKKGLERS